MNDPTEFLLARITEDKAVARAAIGEAVFASQTGRWSFETVRDQYGPVPIVFAVTDTGAKTQVANMEAAWEREQRGAHIARHDPARVLAECEAKRAIVEAWVLADRDAGAYPGTDAGIEMGLHQAMTILATVYADHPAYDEEWRP